MAVNNSSYFFFKFGFTNIFVRYGKKRHIKTAANVFQNSVVANYALYRCAKGAKIITNQYIGQAMVFFSYHHYNFFVGYGVNGNLRVWWQHLAQLFFSGSSSVARSNFQAHKKAVTGLVNMLAHGNNIQQVFCQYGRYRCHQTYTVNTFNYNNHSWDKYRD